MITSQYKAWNNTVRMAMIADLVWVLIKRRDGKMMLWMDNCGPHKTTAIEELLEELGKNRFLSAKHDRLFANAGFDWQWAD